MLIFISLAAYSTGQVVKDFPRSENIKMKEAVISEPPIYLGFMHTTDDYLVIFQRQRNQGVFHFYSLDDLHFVTQGGNIGNGPDDLTNTLFYNYIHPGERNHFTLIDDRSFKRIDMEGGQVKVVKTETIQTPMNMPANNYSKIDDNVYCISNIDITRSYEFILFDKEGENSTWISPYPKWANIKKEELPLITYISAVVPNPALKRFMVFYAKFRRVRMFDSKGNLLKDISVEFPFKFPPYEETDIELARINQKTPPIMLSYSIPYADDKYIFVICYNAKTSDTNKSTELQIWNWNAEPVAVLHLDKGLRQFTISEKKRRLYATDPLNADEKIRGKIFWCDLPKWLYEK